MGLSACARASQDLVLREGREADLQSPSCVALAKQDR